MIKGWYTNDRGIYYYDPDTGAMQKGEVVIDDVPYYFDEITGIGYNGMLELNDRSYWYENAQRQGTYFDPKGVIGDGVVRGREIYDPESGAWYWLDSLYDGAKGIAKEVWIPYIYQNEADWDEEEARQRAKDSDASIKDFIYDAIRNHTGKWVRYDENGRMLKGLVKIEGTLAKVYPDQAGKTYYYDTMTGAMVKGNLKLNGNTYTFDETTGELLFMDED